MGGGRPGDGTNFEGYGVTLCPTVLFELAWLKPVLAAFKLPVIHSVAWLLAVVLMTWCNVMSEK